MNNHLNILLFVASSTLLLASCSESNESYETPNTSGIATNSGVISQKHFSLVPADPKPGVIKLENTEGVLTSTFATTNVEMTVFIGDRNNNTLTDAHVINFKTEYGLIGSSCTTKDGSCSVMWSAIKRPDPGGPGDDGFVTITAYAIGEESFIDNNGNNIFDDADASFDDLEEPFVDINENGLYNIGDTIIDVVNSNDPTGTNGTHDMADGFYNGGSCTHSSLCGIAKSITVFDGTTLSIFSSSVESRTIGGDVVGFNTASTALVLQNNGGDNFTVSANGAYAFATTILDTQDYAVTVLTQPTTPGQVCTVANATGTVSANVTNVDVTCVTDTYTIGGGAITNLLGTGLVLQNNGGDNLTIANTDTSYTFATPVDDGAAYAVTVFTQPTSPNQRCIIANDTGSVPAADVTNADISCINTYTIGGAVSMPLGETLTIQNNLDANSDSIALTNADTNFEFATALDDGSNYDVTQFSYSNGTCAFTNSSGTLTGANVTNVGITCP